MAGNRSNSHSFRNLSPELNWAGDPDSNAQYDEPTLDALKERFHGVIDEDVIEMIWQESDSGGTALEVLASMDCRPEPEPVIQTHRSWSEILSTNISQPFVFKKPEVAKPRVEEEEIIQIIRGRIQQGERILILMRGVSGSGKSYLASQLKGPGVVLSTDDYFINHQGEYIFHPYSLSDAHEWNRRRAEEQVKSGTNPIIIDNTNLEPWEMQSYICIALRNNYHVELVEPNTPWKCDVHMLAQKSQHGVPKEKIRQMLEKFKVPVDIKYLVEECRQKMYPNWKSERNIQSCNSFTSQEIILSGPGASGPANPEAKPQRANSRWNQTRSEKTDVVVKDSKQVWDLTGPWEEKDSAMPQRSSRWQTKSSKPLEQEAGQLVTDVGIQTSSSDSNVRILEARSRDINELTPAMASALPRRTAAKLMLDKSCITEDVIGDDDASIREKLMSLRLHFPNTDHKDLADLLARCQGDLNTAANLLLDSGYHFVEDGDLLAPATFSDVEEVDEEEQPKVEEACSTHSKDEEVLSTVSSSDAACSSSDAQESTEALRKHVENCFVLTDTISDQARRICGKDYSQFRACLLQRSRQPMPTSQQEAMATGNGSARDEMNVPSVESPLPSSAASSTEESESGRLDDEGAGAMIPFVMDPTFAQHLSALFGDPKLGYRQSQQSSQKAITFDIPWSLAEQIYLHWTSSLVDQHEGEPDESQLSQLGLDDSEELRDIMDFELAMQMVDEKKNAERQSLRESLATKLSMAKLREAYPHVDPLALEALFEENNFNYAHTLSILQASLGRGKVASSVISGSKDERGARPRTSEAGGSSAEASSRPATQKVEAGDLRTEAFMYNRLRQECQIKAQENYKRGMSAVAAYYASESRMYAELYKETNRKAALHIVEEKNANQKEQTIDLHELKVAEALGYLESFIVENVREGRTVIQVITGKGNHNPDGRPRIKPAVITFLKKRKYGFEEVNPGCLRVYLRRAIPLR